MGGKCQVAKTMASGAGDHKGEGRFRDPAHLRTVGHFRNAGSRGGHGRRQGCGRGVLPVRRRHNRWDQEGHGHKCAFEALRRHMPRVGNPRPGRVGADAVLLRRGSLDFDTEMKEAGESSDKEKTNELPDGNAHCQRCLEVPRPYSSCVRLCKLAYIALDFDTEMKEAGESSDKEKTN